MRWYGWVAKVIHCELLNIFDHNNKCDTHKQYSLEIYAQEKKILRNFETSTYVYIEFELLFASYWPYENLIAQIK